MPTRFYDYSNEDRIDSQKAHQRWALNDEDKTVMSEGESS
jgi:hypothetical protein